jgi:hypothetical protein
MGTHHRIIGSLANSPGNCGSGGGNGRPQIFAAGLPAVKPGSIAHAASFNLIRAAHFEIAQVHGDRLAKNLTGSPKFL